MPKGFQDIGVHMSDPKPRFLLAPGAAAALLPSSGAVPSLRTLGAEAAARQHLEFLMSQLSASSGTASPGAYDDFDLVGVDFSPLAKLQIVKFRQRHLKIPIFGSLITIEMKKNNELVSVHGSLAQPDIDSVAQLSPQQAIEVVEGYRGRKVLVRFAVPRLWFWYDGGGTPARWRLVYYVDVNDDDASTTLPWAGTGPDDLGSEDYMVDAQDGIVVRVIPRSTTTAQSATDALGKRRRINVESIDNGESRLFDTQLNVHTSDFSFRSIHRHQSELPGHEITRVAGAWDRNAVSAHANQASVANFLRRRLKHLFVGNSASNSAPSFVSSINCVTDETQRDWPNAQWLSKERQVVFGQVTVNGVLRSWAAAREVVAHEMFHAEIERTAKLVYSFQSGALNESYADIFGVAYSNLNGRHAQDPGAWDWTIGASLFSQGEVLRSLSDPQMGTPPQPAHCSGYVDATWFNDHGGVHFNSGIHNKAAYNIFTSRDQGGAYLFKPFDVLYLFYYALTNYLTPESEFLDSRKGVWNAALTNVPNDLLKNAKLTAIEAAFNDVGIGS